jgi:cytochrome c oxidase subunit IV
MSEERMRVGNHLAVFAVLVGLTALTIAVSLRNLGSWNVVIALGVAFAEAMIVMIYPMHLRKATQTVWAIAIGAFVWLLIMVLFILSDLLTRGWMSQPRGW